MESLTVRVLEYQRSRTGLDGLVADLAPRVLRYPRRRFGWDEDACAEFYAWFHPRLLRVLGRFRDQGKPFESYLVSVLHWQARSFVRRIRRDQQAWSMGPRLVAFCGPRIEGESMEEREAPPRTLPAACVPRLESVDRRGLLFLVLKCSRRLDPPSLAAAASATGVAPRDLARLVERLRAGLESCERRLEALRLRRNGAFSRARTLEAALARATDSAEVSDAPTAAGGGESVPGGRGGADGPGAARPDQPRGGGGARRAQGHGRLRPVPVEAQAGDGL